MVKLFFFQAFACTDKNFVQISMKPPVENMSEADFWNVAKSLKSLSADSILDMVESCGRKDLRERA